MSRFYVVQPARSNKFAYASIYLSDVMEKGDGVAIPETGTQNATSSVIEKQSKRRIYKIIVIGDSNVGKTCLTFRFCAGKFPKKVEATIGVDFREKTVDVDGEMIKVRLNQLSCFASWELATIFGGAGDFGPW